jgi:GNAT superfamily N-acetyltransferase
MKIIDLTPQQEPLYHLCLEDWSAEIREAGNHKAQWQQAMKEKGLRVKLALNDHDEVGGMIQYLPVEHSFVEGNQLYVVLCIWVHGHKKGRGNFQKRGFGKALLQAAEADVKSLGAKGLVAWGISLPFWMKASWFKKQGYQKVDKDGMRVLLWKPFTPEASPPKWIREKKRPQTISGKVSVTAFINGWCPAQNMIFERAKRASSELREKVVFREINTLRRETFLEWGISDGVYINGKALRTGPPPKYQKIKRIISRKLKKL